MAQEGGESRVRSPISRRRRSAGRAESAYYQPTDGRMDFFGLCVCRVVRGPSSEAAVVPKQDQLEFRKVGISPWPRELCHSWCKEKILLLLHKTNLLFLASFSFWNLWRNQSLDSFFLLLFPHVCFSLEGRERPEGRRGRRRLSPFLSPLLLHTCTSSSNATTVSACLSVSGGRKAARN